MKPHIQYGFLLLLLICTHAYAQTDIVYKFLPTLDRGRVYFTIIIEAGSICQGITIERGTDGEQFAEIGRIPGICGSSNDDAIYNFIDPEPIPNSYNYYRLIFGGRGTSDIEAVLYLDFGNKYYKILPNPANNVATIYFQNNDNKPYTLTVYNIQGQPVYTVENVKDDHIAVNVQMFDVGMYPFHLTAPDERRLSGKLVVN